MKSKQAVHEFPKLSIKNNAWTTTVITALFNSEFEQTNEMKLLSG